MPTHHKRILRFITDVNSKIYYAVFRRTNVVSASARPFADRSCVIPKQCHNNIILSNVAKLRLITSIHVDVRGPFSVFTSCLAPM